VGPLRGCFKYGNPNTVVKTAVNLLGYPVGKCRAPFNYLCDEGVSELKATLASDREKGMR
jgi:4-hydroxy-tetrahydrodipicolinate synthase